MVIITERTKTTSLGLGVHLYSVLVRQRLAKHMASSLAGTAE